MLDQCAIAETRKVVMTTNTDIHDRKWPQDFSQCVLLKEKEEEEKEEGTRIEDIWSLSTKTLIC